MQTLAERLKIALKGPPEVTQKALADACGIQPPSVSEWLSGRTKNMEGANLLAAAKFLRVNPDWLATGKGEMRPSDPTKLVTQDDLDLAEIAAIYKNLDPANKARVKSIIKIIDDPSATQKAQNHDD
ncbi:helix-turn-helix domain protein [Nitrosomonas sp. Is79A3]|uniref:helix-turn-helix domain-containing protein n=1 Tax=Nitrosomonas sp. (strain Is79A3) TaxID=261292 RepID=UPI000215CAD7